MTKIPVLPELIFGQTGRTKDGPGHVVGLEISLRMA